MDPRILFLVLVAFGLWGVVALERVARRAPISVPMLYVGFGWALFSLPLGLPRLDPVGQPRHALTAEYVTEFIVIVSLMAAGLAIDRRFTWRGWRQVWPLLTVTMPLTIAAVALLGWSWVGLTPAAAILLGAALAPTDPVLAGAVQVGPPSGPGEPDDVRFDLTAEAGLNDGLAFPFTYLAIAAVGKVGLGGWVFDWIAVDVVWRILAGVAIGVAVGRLGTWYVLRVLHPRAEGEEGGETNEGAVVMATLLAAYGLAEAAEGYGFLAVFAGAVTARQYEIEHAFHGRTHHFVDQVEEVVLVVLLLGFGGLLASGILSALTLKGALLAAALVFVIRPLAGLAGLWGSSLPWPGRLAVAFLGIRGMGTLYYLSYGQNQAAVDDVDRLWATASFAILLSILIHGVTANRLMAWGANGPSRRVRDEEGGEADEERPGEDLDECRLKPGASGRRAGAADDEMRNTDGGDD